MKKIIELILSLPYNIIRYGSIVGVFCEDKRYTNIFKIKQEAQ